MYEIMVNEIHARGDFVSCVIAIDDDNMIPEVESLFDQESECVRTGLLKSFTILVVQDDYVNPISYAPPHVLAWE